MDTGPLPPAKQKGRMFEAIPESTEIIAKAVLDSAFKVHTFLGPGLLESVYEACLAHEVQLRGIAVETQVVLPIFYEGTCIQAGLRLDMLVGKCLIVEIKAVEKMIPIYEAQLLTYLKLSNIRLGLLINFNVIHLKYGIKRLIY